MNEFLDWDSPLPDSNNGYSERLQKDERWQRIRKLVIKRDGERCTMCKSTSNLRVHHLSYWDFYNPDYLITLCDKCHSQVHSITNRFKEAIYDHDSELSHAMHEVNEALSHIIDPFIMERCAELSKDGDIHFFTGPRKKQVNLNGFINALIASDPYKTYIQKNELCFWGKGNSSFSRYNKIRLNRKQGGVA